jgi:hypothetical protein
LAASPFPVQSRGWNEGVAYVGKRRRDIEKLQISKAVAKEPAKRSPQFIGRIRNIFQGGKVYARVGHESPVGHDGGFEENNFVLLPLRRRHNREKAKEVCGIFDIFCNVRNKEVGCVEIYAIG